jgi:hypothetical protein
MEGVGLMWVMFVHWRDADQKLDSPSLRHQRRDWLHFSRQLDVKTLINAFHRFEINNTNPETVK